MIKFSRAVKSFNFFGIRGRHAICEKWIEDKFTIQHVISHLKAANFDPEFFKQHEEDIRLDYNQKYPHHLAQKMSKKGLFTSYASRVLFKN